MPLAVEPRSINRYYVFLASPSDVNDERQAVQDFFDQFNAASTTWNIEFQVLRWENVSAGRVGRRPQEHIISETMEQYKDSLVLFIGLMWRRFGRETGTHASGTEEEFEWAYQRALDRSWPEIKWFFRKADTFVVEDDQPEGISRELEQWKHVWEFRQKIFQNFLCKEYADTNDFVRVFSGDLLPWLFAPDRAWMRAVLREQVPEPETVPMGGSSMLTKIGEALRRLNLFREVKPPPAPGYITPSIQWNHRIVEPRELFDERTRRSTHTTPFVIVSPPGGGKSLLLSQLQLWARRLVPAAWAGVPTQGLLAVHINLGIMDVARDFSDWPAQLIHTQLERVLDEHDLGLYNAAINDCFRNKNIYLFFDGLDEFAIGNKDYVQNLIKRCCDLARSGIPVTLACRTWFWSYQVPPTLREAFSIAEIKEFDDGQAVQFLGDRIPGLPPGVFVDPTRTRLRDWMRNPKVLSFVRDASKPFESKSDVFRDWAQRTALMDKKRLHRGDLQDHLVILLFGDLAVFLSRERTREVKQEYFERSNAEATGSYWPADKPSLDYESICEFSFLTREGSGAATQFSHSLVWEYFVAERLAAEFEETVSGGTAVHYKELALSLAALDFVPSSVYGFLSEILGPDYERRLLEWLSKPPVPLPDLPARLLFNLIEYVGKSSLGEHRDAFDLLLAVLGNTLLDHDDGNDPKTLVRYNAARALERLHVGAPRPYFDWASDWGVADWSSWSFDRESWNPWAVRGSRLRERRPGISPRMDIDFTRAKGADSDLQRRVCDALIETLEETEDEFLQVNCSHALVRWYDFRDYDLDRKLDGLIDRLTNEHVEENIARWVKKAAWRLR